MAAVEGAEEGRLGAGLGGWGAVAAGLLMGGAVVAMVWFAVCGARDVYKWFSEMCEITQTRMFPAKKSRTTLRHHRRPVITNQPS